MTVTEIQDQYPSTFDVRLPPIAGGQEDMVALCLAASRKRIRRGHSRSAYYARDVAGGGTYVCAVGAVLAEDGFRVQGSYGSEGKRIPIATGAELWLQIEDQLSDTAKEAIAVLNEVARERHPESAANTTWQGPLEWVNQAWPQGGLSPTTGKRLSARGRDRMVKKEVLTIYDEAITRREAALV